MQHGRVDVVDLAGSINGVVFIRVVAVKGGTQEGITIVGPQFVIGNLFAHEEIIRVRHRSAK